MATDYGPLPVWAVIVAAGVATFAIRGSFVYLFGRIDEVPASVTRALRYVPPAVFAALVAPSLIVVEGSVAVGPGNERLLAGVVAAAVTWYADSLLVTISVGMVTLWLLRFVV
ncbi:AzlD domain-containing protein [Halopelagius longus]|uniref:AzlD domain-containing protein n=1 Tax=Halopelagius longus TaxID=1236180 RepID=A0A1H0Y2D5_9EURY|nr:AzlD domain-containing protein [Halopelagius longus]RDI72240.1 AzlD domain-containing protein [Halopelagius longus]SDQ09308.1 Branched-chain amino acid transport protein [Halopelagius longus]